MCNGSVANIYVTWRAKKGDRRTVVGVVKRNSTQGVRFKYVISHEEMDKIGFVPYADFPDVDKVYTKNVLDILSQRLNKPERPDIQNYYDFWEISPKYRTNLYYMLAHTQGLLATDNFEFLAKYNPTKDLSFVSEVCGLSHAKFPSDMLQNGETLTWKLEKNNQFDRYAVAVYKGDIRLGYIKIIHNRVFHDKRARGLRISVKSIESNGHLNRVFVKVSFTQV